MSRYEQFDRSRPRIKPLAGRQHDLYLMLIRTVADGGERFYFRGEHRATLPALWRLL